MFVFNAFSLNMVKAPCTIKVTEVPLEEAQLMAQAATSGVGHAETAAIFTALLGTEIPMNRATIQLEGGEAVLVGQYSGPRLPEGATTLPEGATIKWLYVSVYKPEQTLLFGC